MSNNKTTYEAAYAKLRTAYITRLEGNITDLTKWIRDVSATPLSKEELLNMQSLAHGLSGSGTTFGFPNVTDAGRNADIFLEKMIRAIRGDDDFIKGDEHPEMLPLLQSIHDACREAVTNYKEQAALEIIPATHEEKLNFEAKKNLFVLIVDDDINLRNMISMKLEQRGFIAAGAGSDQEMIVSMEKRLPDLIILDLNLPDNSGHEVLRRLKSEPAHAAIPILMLTAAAKEADVVAALHSGASSYIVKPVDINRLSERVEKISANMRRTVLVADNDQLILALLQSKFKGRGFNVVLTNNGLSTFEHAQRVKPDLIILDIAMPGMDGISVLKMIRNDKKTKDIPVIIASAKTTPADIAAGMAAGAQDYVPKPFNADDLVHRSIALLKKEKANDT
jgi:DNA-binding response OmpR family regulator